MSWNFKERQKEEQEWQNQQRRYKRDARVQVVEEGVEQWIAWQKILDVSVCDVCLVLTCDWIRCREQWQRLAVYPFQKGHLKYNRGDEWAGVEGWWNIHVQSVGQIIIGETGWIHLTLWVLDNKRINYVCCKIKLNETGRGWEGQKAPYNQCISVFVQ